MKIRYRIILFMIIVFIMLSVPVVASHYPLVVYGGEPEGIMAAVAAARNGTKTLLIMNRKNPGGLMTYGKLNYLDLSYDSDGNILSNQIFKEWHRNVGGNVTFNIDRAIDVFNNMISKEENITIYRECELIDVSVKNNKIKNIKIKNKNIIREIVPERVIDASQNAELAVKAKVPYFYGGADIGLPHRTMAATLILKLGNIDISQLENDIISNKFGPSYIGNKHAWGFIELGRMYKEHHSNIRLRGLNIVLDGNQDRKNAYINAMLIFNVSLKKEQQGKISLQQAYKITKKEASFVVSYLQNNLGGFAKVKLLQFPEELYIRESRHIVSKYQLKTSDILANKIFEDTIALASYPLDYQASDPNYEGFVLFNPDIYGIPLRSLVPYNSDNILIVGREAGYSSLAAASARVLPTGMSTGEAAGVAATVSLKNNILFTELINNKELIRLIQKKLSINREIPGCKNNIVEDDLVLPYLNELISWGLVIGGYDNNFKLENDISEIFFSNILIKGLKRKDAEIFYEWVPGGLTTLSKKQALSRDRAAMLLLAATSHRISEMNKKKYYQQALKYELFPSVLKNKLEDNRLLTRREAFILAGNLLMKYKAPVKLRFYRGED